VDEKVRVHAVISGKVQGVFFRMETKGAAERFGVSGWVRNKRDGTVEAVFEGNREDVESVLAWCGQGPPASKVASVDIEWEEYTGGFTKFEVTY